MRAPNQEVSNQGKDSKQISVERYLLPGFLQQYKAQNKQEVQDKIEKERSQRSCLYWT